MCRPDNQTIHGASTVKPAIHRVFVAQFLVLSILSGLTGLYRCQLAVSLLMGGLIQLLPSIYFARQVYKFSGASAAHRVAQSFYRGEMGKFILTAIGFALVFSVAESVSPPAIFAGFGLMIASHAGFVALLKM